MAIDFVPGDRYQIGSAVVTAYPLTMACWFNPDDLATSRTLMCLGNLSGGTGVQRIAAGSAAVNAQSESSVANGTANSLTAPTTATWQHAVGVFESATDRRAYLNGGNKGTDATSVAFATTINRTVIGQRLRTGTFGLSMDGKIAECAIWNISLSDQDIEALYEGYRPSLIRPENLILYVPMIRDVFDYSAAQTLTATGSPTVAVHTRRIG